MTLHETTDIDAGYSTPRSSDVRVEITHEAGSFDRDLFEEHTSRIAPSNEPTVVTFVSRVIVRPARRLKSSEYLATVRRRGCRKLATMVQQLAPRADADDFHAHTYPLVKQLRDDLAKIQEASSEGNAREVLRQVRDSLMDGGWESYRNAEARQAVSELLEELAAMEHVEPECAERAREMLESLGLGGGGIPLFNVEEAQVPY